MSETMFVKRNPIREATAGKNSSPSSSSLNVAVAHLRLGSYYEIDSSILPQRSPEQLKSIRIVMVSKITASAVSLRYPSMCSLRSYFDFKNMNRNKPEKRRSGAGGSLLPVLDESHVMSSDLAGELLYRRITPHEVSMDRNSWNFWVSSGRNNVSRKEMVSQPAYNTRLRRAVSPEGKCSSELRSGGMIKWGRRLRVQYKSRHDEFKKSKEGEENSGVKNEEVCKEEIEEDDEDDGNETEEAKQGSIVAIDGTRKMKMIESSTERRAQKAQKKETQFLVYQRRKSDKKLKLEARKLIGDTGLLDHFLKHMASKVAPGGQDRFMRKHNADSAMEYWLESSDLIHIRKEAGVEDPYWTPPPGWKLGDNPTQDAVCAGEIREIKEELASLESGLEKLASKKEEEERVIVTTPNSCVTSHNVDHDNLMTPGKEIYADLLKKKYKIEDQLVIISETLREMEEDMGWLKKTVDENCLRMPDLTETPLLLEDSPKVNTLEGAVKVVNNKGKQITESLQNKGKGKKYERSPLSLIRNTGFRICKPMGSFAWPSLPSLTTATDTETSNAVLASSPSHRPTYPSSCPVKPLAARRPHGLPFTQRRAQKAQKKETQIVVYQRRKSDKKFIDRWSLERYKLAEKNMLKVMKEKNAVFGNSILRPELRSEARKLIGDTGLLDHFLKHMAGKVAPGGQDRFMRKHNAEGVIEYWLESSDLIHIRKEAGVEDPYWTPPPGWKLGDNPTQDPVCAGEIREIKEELASLKSSGLEKLASKKEEEERVIVTTPNSCVTSQNVDHDNLMTLAKEIYADLLKKKYKIEDQLVIIIISETLREMEEDMGWLKKTVDENCPRLMPHSTETPLLLEDSPKVNTLEGEVKVVNNKGKQNTESLQHKGKGKKYERSPLSLISNTGFRICKPMGSFAWPTLPALTTATDTETSNAELASSLSHQPTYPSPYPVKPLAAKRPLGLPFTQRRAQKAQKKETQIVVYQRRKSDKKFIDRWSLERYKLAEKNMLKVMKEKNAVFGNSILRPELRLEARKLIGDTGLLDHLLKHMLSHTSPKDHPFNRFPWVGTGMLQSSSGEEVGEEEVVSPKSVSPSTSVDSVWEGDDYQYMTDEDEEETGELGGGWIRYPSRTSPLTLLPLDYRRRLRENVTQPITENEAMQCFSYERSSYIRETHPVLESYFMSDSNGYLFLYWLTQGPGNDFIVEEEIRRILKLVSGPIRDQLEHLICWAYAVCDLISSCRLLHGLDKEFLLLSPMFLCRNVYQKEYIEKFQAANEAHYCFGGNILEGLMYAKIHGILEGLMYAKIHGIPKEKPEERKFDCRQSKEFINGGEELYKISEVFYYETLELALERVKSGYPVAASLHMFESRPPQGNDQSTYIYDGPKSGGKYIRRHAVIINDFKIINGIKVAMCKSSNGEGFHNRGYMAVNTEIMISLVGATKRKDCLNMCKNEPQYLLENFFSIDMEMGLEPLIKVDPDRAKENMKFKVETDWFPHLSAPKFENPAKAEEKKSRRDGKKLSPEDDIDAILLSIQKKEVHVEENVAAPSPRSNCSLTINPSKATEWQEIKPKPGAMWPTARSGFQFFVYQDEIFLYGGYSKEVSSEKSSGKGIVHADLWSLDPRTWEWNKVKKIGMPPISRAGFSVCVHKKRALLFGGVVDMEMEGDVMMSLFLNELYGFQLDNHSWYPIELRKEKSSKDKAKKILETKPMVSSNDDEMDSTASAMDEQSEGVGSSDGISERMAAGLVVEGTRSNTASDKSKAVQGPKARLDPEVSVSEEVVKPCGRINSCMVVGKDTLYIYCGMMEIKDKEITLDDLYSLNLSKLDEWKCIIPATETEWVEVSEDEEGDEDEDEDDSDDERNSEESDDEEVEAMDVDGSVIVGEVVAMIKGEGKSLRRKEKRARIEQIRANLGLSDSQRTPAPGETLKDFYKRTNMYWQMAAYEHTQHTGKVLRKDGFDLAETRYLELKPILDELAILEAEQKAEEADGPDT